MWGVHPVGDGYFGVTPATLLDAPTAEIASVGREVLTDRDVQRAAVGELLLLLKDALPECVSADDRRPAVVLKGRGDDLRGRGGVGVD